MTRFNLLLPNQATAARYRPTGPNGLLLRCAPRIMGAFLSVLIMLALKRHYSLATADQLDWILAPTARLVAWFTSAHPAYESGVGYVDFARGIIIAPACAGINFMIMAFGLAVVCGLTQCHRPAAVSGLIVLALPGAYGYTVLVNTLRIALSTALYRMDIYGQWLTVMRLHRLCGVGLYLAALWLLFKGLQWALSLNGRQFTGLGSKEGRSLPAWLPLCWYAVGTVGLPIMNVLHQVPGPALAEHCTTILTAVACVGGSAKLIDALRRPQVRTTIRLCLYRIFNKNRKRRIKGA